MSWGLLPWGLSPWGTTAAPAPSVAGIVALTLQSVRVTFGAPPDRRTSRIGLGDVLNPASWRMTVAGRAILVLDVVAQDATNYIVSTLQQISAYLETHDVEATLMTSSGALDSPTVGTFTGLTPMRPEFSKFDLIDMANAQASATDQSGVLRVGADGDYASESGITLYRKLIIRRLTTITGTFMHLPQYGFTLRLKEPTQQADLVKLRAKIQLELTREPEFEAVAVRLSLGSDNVLLIEVRVTLTSTGENVTIPVLATPGSVLL